MSIIESGFDLVAIEQAIKEAIKQLNRPYIRSIATYGGEFDENLSEVIRNFPAVWVTFSHAVPAPIGTSKKKWRMELVFVVLVGARSIRNEQASRHGIEVNGQQVEVGTFQLLADVQQALLHQKLGLAILPFSMGRITTLFNTRLQNQAISVLSQEWKTEITLVFDDDVGAQPLLSLGVDYYLHPNNPPVATDEVELTL